MYLYTRLGLYPYLSLYKYISINISLSRCRLFVSPRLFTRPVRREAAGYRPSPRLKQQRKSMCVYIEAGKPGLGRPPARLLPPAHPPSLQRAPGKREGGVRGGGWGGGGPSRAGRTRRWSVRALARRPPPGHAALPGFILLLCRRRCRPYLRPAEREARLSSSGGGGGVRPPPTPPKLFPFPFPKSSPIFNP